MAMEGVRREIARAIVWLNGDVEERQYQVCSCYTSAACLIKCSTSIVSTGLVSRPFLQAAMLIRIAVADAERKKVAQDLEAVLALVPILKYGAKHPTTLVAVEALACLVTQDPKGRVRRTHTR